MLLPKTIDTFGVWTQFTGYYFQELHDIFLKNGIILKSALPSAEGWSLKGRDIPSWDYYYDYCKDNDTVYIKDSEVIAIRLLTDEDIIERKLLWNTGKERLKRINDNFADGREHVLLDRNYLIKDNQIATFVNDIREVAIKYGATQQLREHIGRRVKMLLINLTYKR